MWHMYDYGFVGKSLVVLAYYVIDIIGKGELHTQNFKKFQTNSS